MTASLRQPALIGSALLLAIGCAATPASGPAAGAASPTGSNPDAQEGPPLVVLMVIDQLPASALDRFGPAFDGGLRRLLDQGLTFRNATHDHSVTETAPGHATIATGTEPAKHGVPSNDWWEFTDGQMRPVLNVIDPTVPLIDDESLSGASPSVLRRSTLAEWMQDADDDTRVVSVSGKPRGAVLLAGHSDDAHVYWFDEAVGRFVSSRHYRDRYPGWVRDFNDEQVAAFAADSVWELTVPDRHRSLARSDSFPWEGDAVHTAFPHAYSDGSGDQWFWAWWAATPALDAATLDLAKLAVVEEDLGDDAVPDLLAVSLSQTDRVGHGYGPRSLEQLDNLVRLDRELEEFFGWLDDRFGDGGYLVAWTSDHGVLDMPEVRFAEGLPGLRLTQESVAPLQEILDRVGTMTDMDERARTLAEAVPHVSWIDRAWTHAALQAAVAQPDSFTQLQRSGYVPDRMAGILSRAGIELQFTEGTLSWVYPVGTGHGSPYHYDRHVPMGFYGWGIEAGTREERVSVADIAPSLARLLGITAPDDLDGVARAIR
jgi:predicted AlkP superfamily pyrophosphatase or phosphodiesterase